MREIINISLPSESFWQAPRMLQNKMEANNYNIKLRSPLHEYTLFIMNAISIPFGIWYFEVFLQVYCFHNIPENICILDTYSLPTPNLSALQLIKCNVMNKIQIKKMSFDSTPEFWILGLDYGFWRKVQCIFMNEKKTLFLKSQSKHCSRMMCRIQGHFIVYLLKKHTHGHSKNDCFISIEQA